MSKAGNAAQNRYMARLRGDNERLAELETEHLAERIRAIVDRAPPFTPEQKRRLALLLDRGEDDPGDDAA
jgi:hypothetical protein